MKSDLMEEKIGSCAIFPGCSGLEALPDDWRGPDGRLQKLVVFGYGSVIWKPGIRFAASYVGYISGFVRRMWQGNETHRGSRARPGRVATLVPKPGKKTFGKAFVLETEDQIRAALDHLIMREIALGGYRLGFTPFYTRSNHSDDASESTDLPESFPALVFGAADDGAFYMGPSKMPSMAAEVASAHGPSGHNVEYLVKICDFMREEVADVADNHLFRLEKLTLRILSEKGIDYRTLAYPERFNVIDAEKTYKKMTKYWEPEKEENPPKTKREALKAAPAAIPSVKCAKTVKLKRVYSNEQ